MALKTIVPGSDPLASDVQQIIDALLGKHDVGALSLFAPITQIPGAPTAAASASAGTLNGTYRYKASFVTGYNNGDGSQQIQGETAGGTTSASITVTNLQVNLTAIPVGPPGTIARRIYRTAAGGADGTQKLVVMIADNTTTTYVDNKADGALGVAVPTTNTTGTTLTVPSLTATNLTFTTVSPQAPHQLSQSDILFWMSV